MERIKDHLLLEEEFVQNQERLKPQEDKDAEERTKVDDLRGSPMTVGTLEEIIDDEHAIVSSATGPEHYVSIMSFVDKDMLEPGCSVLLHNHSNAVVGVLADDADPMVSVMKVDKAPTESYEDVGGLEAQIQEIKVRYHFMLLDYVAELEAELFSLHYALTGIGRASPHTSRIVRRDGHQASKRCHPVWTPRNREDALGQGCRQSDFCDILAHGWL